MQIMADIPNWCVQKLPATGASSTLSLMIAASFAIIAGCCLLKASRQTIVVSLVVALAVGVLGAADPASAAPQISCPSGYEPAPNPAKLSLDFTAESLVEDPETPSAKPSRFILKVDLNGGVVYDKFTVAVTGTALVNPSPKVTETPTVLSGAGWTIAAKDNDPRSGVYILTYTPNGATTRVPAVDVRFALRTEDLKLGENWGLAATASGIPGNTATATAAFPFALYDKYVPCGPDFVDKYYAFVERGFVVTPATTMVSGTPPYKYVAAGLSGYTMAEDGAVTWVDAQPGLTEFTLTVTDGAGTSLTVPAAINYADNFIYVPDTC